MTPQRWNQIVQLFNAVLESPQAERAAFLDAACAQDGETRAELDRLLNAFESDPEFMQLATHSGNPERSADFCLVEGEKFGPYELVRPLASGGMGAIFLAERSDGAFQQQVAIKLMNAVGQGDSLRRRFLREREILARLDHPNICKLLDGGVSIDGSLWFAMPFIEGAQTITEHAELAELDIQARVELFLQVCDAVHFAHQNLIIHADLKPANILVNAQGSVRLVDFGIARMLQGEAGTSDTTMMSEKARPLTPQYASPEQILGQSPTTASDIYSLGVILFRLLSGQAPYQFATGTAEEVLHVVSQWEPIKPSYATQGSARIARALRGDLDNIILKAMDKERARRYTSVAALAEDLHRWLDGKPVQARGASLAYQINKFARRHTAAVSAAAIALTMLIAFAISMTLAAGRIAVEAEIAAQERDRAEAVAGFLSDVLREVDPVKTKSATSVQELIQRGYDKLQADKQMGPAERAAILGVIASAFHTLGEFDQAAGAADLALAPLDAGAAPAQAYFEAAHIRTEVALRRQRAAAARIAAARTQALLDALPDSPFHQRTRALNNLATLHRWQGEIDKAIAVNEQAIALTRQNLGKPNFTMDNLGIELSNQANLHFHRARELTGAAARAHADKAAPLAEEALALHRSVYGDEHPRIAFTLNTLGKTQMLRGDWEAAAASLERAVELASAKLGAKHPFLAYAGNYLGEVRILQQRPELARAALENAQSVAAIALAPDNEMHRSIAANLAKLSSSSNAGQE